MRNSCTRKRADQQQQQRRPARAAHAGLVGVAAAAQFPLTAAELLATRPAGNCTELRRRAGASCNPAAKTYLRPVSAASARGTWVSVSCLRVTSAASLHHRKECAAERDQVPIVARCRQCIVLPWYLAGRKHTRQLANATWQTAWSGCAAVLSPRLLNPTSQKAAGLHSSQRASLFCLHEVKLQFDLICTLVSCYCTGNGGCGCR